MSTTPKTYDDIWFVVGAGFAATFIAPAVGALTNNGWLVLGVLLIIGLTSVVAWHIAHHRRRHQLLTSSPQEILPEIRFWQPGDVFDYGTCVFERVTMDGIVYYRSGGVLYKRHISHLTPGSNQSLQTRRLEEEMEFEGGEYQELISTFQIAYEELQQSHT